MSGKSWALMLTTEAIRRGAEMGSNLFHLQIVIEEMARTKPHAWPGVPEIARRMGRDVRTARRLLAEWEKAGHGRRVIEGKANDLVGLILFRRLDPKMPSASPETFEAAVEALKADRRVKHTSDKIVLGPGSNSSEPSDNPDLPSRSISSEPPRSTLSDVISIHPEPARSEPSVNQSDRLTDVSPSGDGRAGEMPLAAYSLVWAVVERLEHLPPAFQVAVDDPSLWDAVRSGSKRVAVVLKRAAAAARRGVKFDNPEGYILAAFDKMATKDRVKASEDAYVIDCLSGAIPKKFERLEGGDYVRCRPPGPAFYRAAPGEIIPLPSERRPNAEAYRVHTAPADSPFGQVPKWSPSTPASPVAFRVPDLNAIDDASIACDPDSIVRWVKSRHAELAGDESPRARIIAEIEGQSERLKITGRRKEARAIVASRALEDVSSAAAG